MTDDNPFADPLESQSFPTTSATLGRPSVSVAAASAGRWPLRSQIAVLPAVVASAFLLGFASFRSLAGIRVAADGLAEMSQWSWWLCVGLVATFAVAVLALVCLVRTQAGVLPAAITVVAGLMLPPIAVYLGLRWGFDVASLMVGEDIATLVSSGPGSDFFAWLTRLFGG